MNQEFQNDVPWWEVFHVEEMADLYLDRTDSAELKLTIEFLKTHLNLQAGDSVFDQCCGTGTLTLALLEHGISGVGVDLCRIFIDRATKKLEEFRRTVENGPSASFHCEDAFEFVPPYICNGGFNWFSSFGYAEDDQQNIQMLYRGFESLTPGSYFLMDVPNFYFIIRNFQNYLVKEGVSNGRKVTLMRHSTLEVEKGRLDQKWSWYVEGNPVDKRYSSLKIYLPDQIIKLLKQAGFEIVRLFGSLSSDCFQLDSPRLIVKARKPL